MMGALGQLHSNADKITIGMNSQKQTDSQLSSREGKTKGSSKRLAQIRIHIKTEKNNKERKYKHRNTLSRDRNAHADTDHRKIQRSSKSIRENSLTQLPSQGSEMKWSVAKGLGGRTALPEITEYRGVTEWVGKGSATGSKKSIPSKSLKIPFKELIPIKEISKEDRIQNLRKIRDEFRELVNTSNNILVRNSESVFRGYVQKGNNGVLVKELLKKRWWWHLQEKPEKANFFWTEWFNSSHTREMPELATDHTRLNDDYNYRSTEQEPKVQSIRMIVDEETFTKIRPRICLRDEHYLRNHHQSFQVRQNGFEAEVREVTALNNTIHNHIDGCLQLHSKKLLFKNLYSYLKRKEMDPFEFMPVTYYIDKNNTAVVEQILAHYDQIEAMKESDPSHNLWIVKPGENSNRGFGITVHSDRDELQQQLTKRLEDGRRSVIIQKYLENCFLVYGRKFDIRCYILITTVNGCLKGYWYNDGYIRTSSEEYSLDDPGNRMVHLTNDAVQKHNQSYGKYEDFNKMSFPNFRKYIAKNGFDGLRFDEAYDKMKLIAYHLIASTSPKIKRKQYTFELFGLDFMLDHQLKPLLIEANSNPCLETSGVILGKLIPELVDNVLMTAVDPLFPPPNKAKAKEYLSKDYFRCNKFQLIFSDGQADCRHHYASQAQ